MRDTTFRTIGATAVLLGIAVAAVAQVGADEEAPAQLATPAGTATELSERGGSSMSADRAFAYRVGLLAGVSATNFWEYIGDQPTAWNSYVLGPTKPALYGIDPERDDLTPELAAHPDPPQPTWDANGWRVRVELEDFLAWSDGEPITARDVVYTFETVRRLGLGGGWAEAFPPEIEGMAAMTDTELTIEFSQRPGLGVWPYGAGMAPLMPAHIWAPLTADIDGADDLYRLDGDADVSGGPLQIVTITDDLIEAVANPGHAGSEFDTVSYTVFEEEAAVAALTEGRIDTILDPNGLSEPAIRLLDGNSGVTLARSPAASVRYLGFNLTRTPMSEPAFRHSLALLLDREHAAEALLDGGTAAYTMLSPANRRWFDQERAESIADLYRGELEGRLASALGQLQGAGYAWETAPALSDGVMVKGVGLTIGGQTPAPLTILTPGDRYDPSRIDYTEQIETTLELLGFEVRPVVTDFDTVVDLAFTEDDSGERQYDMYVLGWTLGSPVLPDYYRWLFATDGAANSTGYSDPDFEAGLGRYLDATDPDRARDALWEMEQILARDLPYLVLYHPEIVEGYRSDRVSFDHVGVLGGIQGRLGGLADLHPAP